MTTHTPTDQRTSIGDTASALLFPKLLNAAKGLSAETHRLKKDVKKDFALMNAEAYLDKVVHEIENFTPKIAQDELSATTSPPPAIADGFRTNFNTMLRAASNGDLALVSARHKDGRPAVLVCAMQANPDRTITPVPFAIMVDGNPFEMFQDPTTDAQ